MIGEPITLETPNGVGHLVCWRDKASFASRSEAQRVAERLLDEGTNEAAFRAAVPALALLPTEDLVLALADALVGGQVHLLRTQRQHRRLDQPEIVNLADLVEPETPLQQTWLSLALLNDDFTPATAEFALTVAGSERRGRTESGTVHERNLPQGQDAHAEFERIELPIRPRSPISTDPPGPVPGPVVPDGPGGEEPKSPDGQ